ncbi:MAG: CCA tRNA nucleotidyltransferase, partial [Chloroflexi bacterium]
MPKNPKLIDKTTAGRIQTPGPAPADKWLGGLTAEARTAVERVLAIGGREAVPAYLVGGPLRDLLLGHPSLDIDIAVEGDAIALAQTVLRGWGIQPDPTASTGALRVKTHAAFGTATISGEGFAIDLATARAETYARPGALPDVQTASIHEDLLRRDFTINAMALRLDGAERGRLLDPAGGQADLEAGRIRVLHARSFQDDATRILRAARYEARLGFRVEEETLAWLQRDLPYLNTISGARLHHEFARTLAEGQPERALLRLQQLGGLEAVFSGLKIDERMAAAFAELRRMRSGLATAYWALLARPLDETQAAAFASRLALTKPQREAVVAMPSLRRLEDGLGPAHLKRSEAFEM